MMTENERAANARIHAEKYEKIAQWLGLEKVAALVPYTRAMISYALQAGDEHLNTLPLAGWDAVHREPKKNLCPHCKQPMPVKGPPLLGVYDLFTAAVKRDRAAGHTPKYFGWSLAMTVCVLKHVAIFHTELVK